MPRSRTIGRASLTFSWLAGARCRALLSAVLFLAGVSMAHASTGEINKLSDVSFTTLNPLVSTTSAQSVCVYSSSGAYSVTGTGSGSGGAFTLTAGAGLTLPYGVQWSATSGAASGTALRTGVALSGQTTTASLPGCTIGAATTASLIVTLAATDLQAAAAGVTYTGTLTLVVAAQ